MPKKKEKPEKICPICKESFYLIPSVAKHRKFCSRNCASIYNSQNRAYGQAKESPNYKQGKYSIIEKICLSCGERFRGNRKRKYCSRKCAIKERSRLVKIHCKYCGKEFQLAESQLKYRGTYCSRGCMGKAYSQINVGKNSPRWSGGNIKTKCLYCNNTIYKTKPQYKNAKNHFCSTECYHSWSVGKNSHMSRRSGALNNMWRGGKSFEPYGIGFNKQLKEAIRIRDNYQCQFCGTTQNGREFPVHHIDSSKTNHSPINLITLCDSHHSQTISNRKKWQLFFEIYQEIRQI